jgi:hypothetical protein
MSCSKTPITRLCLKSCSGSRQTSDIDLRIRNSGEFRYGRNHRRGVFRQSLGVTPAASFAKLGLELQQYPGWTQ